MVLVQLVFQIVLLVMPPYGQMIGPICELFYLFDILSIE